jgi:peroxiredoxin family protein
MSDRLSLIVFSGNYDRVHYAMAMASAAAATVRPVTLLFTMAGIRALLAPQPDGAPGWTTLGSAGDAAARDRERASDGVATLEELIAACVEFGVTFKVCEMGLAAERLSLADLRDDVPVSEGGLVGFFGEAERDNGRIVFI